MATDLIRYDLIVQDAMRGVMRKVLGEVAAMGALPGEHHFTISFRTDAPGVKISRRLAQQWPQEMTIILQHQYSNLSVDDQGFGVTLSFRSIPENLYIPFAAVTVFSDPSVEFGFKFNLEDERGEPEEQQPAKRPGPSLVRPDQDYEAPAAPPAPAPQKSEAASEPDAAAASADGDKIVSIDAFRKKT
ncbi:SspB family protein [Methylocystis heyeri]|uniref:Stringent starvation protein B n=1 Tax=Methylocystis heyeri TaxID=391905 RepID=A0A6B8KCD4_9HYPH|nr:ClpXP protease specificity-enhancing factor SspB [Methylocystis heyeri]QGM45327.1 hypothetical protein H2LOC_006240 [Methylocystis heyeri]